MVTETCVTGTVEERIHCLDGGSPFWAGLTDMGQGGYHQRPFPGARVDRLGVPGFNFSDGPRGAVIGPATAFPVSMARGASFDLDLEDGSVQFRTSVDVEQDEDALTPTVLKHLLYHNVITMDRYLPGLQALLEEGVTPIAAIAVVEAE